MIDSAITFEILALEPQVSSERAKPAEPDGVVLPDAFAGYQRSRKSLMVTAARDGIIIGMGGGSIYERADNPPQLWIDAAEVNEPFRGTGLERALIDALLQAAKEGGFAAAGLSEGLQKHLAH